ncbi:MAG: hypothetical protein H6832_04025 [Planctomycetes bacterium]|nr:hypothetical protein [Planctomycetota bacterium]MCB9892628.1 hypothetical protein [Planctomycetota bacterium]MCB9917550.1 hypothetical protein [Planctomycetota bacterium]
MPSTRSIVIRVPIALVSICSAVFLVACGGESKAHESWVALCTQELESLRKSYEALHKSLTTEATAVPQPGESARMLAARVKARIDQLAEIERMISIRAPQQEVRSQLAILKERLHQLEDKARESRGG